jgi:hypothetical protein
MTMKEMLEEGISRRKSVWAERNARIKESYEMREMVDKLKVPGLESMAISDVRAGFNLAKHVLSRNPPRHRMPVSDRPLATVENNDLEVSDQFSKAERFLIGAWRGDDELLWEQGRDWFTRIMADWMLGSGFWAVWTEVWKDAEGQPWFIADPLDPSDVYPEYGGIRDGMTACDRVIHWRRSQVIRHAEQFGWQLPHWMRTPNRNNDIIEITDHWENKYNRLKPSQPDVLNAVLLTSTTGSFKPVVLKDIDNEPQYVRIPIFTGPVGGMEVSGAYYGHDTPAGHARKGESILVTPREAYASLNRVWTYSLNDLKESIQRTILHKSQGAQGGITEADLGRIINLDLNEQLTELTRQVMTSNFGLTRDGLEGMLQRAMIPFTQFGQAPFELSGIAIERLNESAKAIIGPSEISMERLLGHIDRHWMSEFKRKFDSDFSVRLAGRARGFSDLSSLFDEEFTPDDLPESRHVDVDVPLALPSDMLMRANIARMLQPQGDIVDDYYVLDEVLMVQDPELMRRRRISDQVDKSEQSLRAEAQRRVMEKIERARDEGDEHAVALYTLEFVQLIQTPSQGQAPPNQPGIQPGAGSAFETGREGSLQRPNGFQGEAAAPGLRAP